MSKNYWLQKYLKINTIYQLILKVVIVLSFSSLVHADPTAWSVEKDNRWMSLENESGQSSEIVMMFAQRKDKAFISEKFNVEISGYQCDKQQKQVKIFASSDYTEGKKVPLSGVATCRSRDNGLTIELGYLDGREIHKMLLFTGPINIYLDPYESSPFATYHGKDYENMLSDFLDAQPDLSFAVNLAIRSSLFFGAHKEMGLIPGY